MRFIFEIVHMVLCVFTAGKANVIKQRVDFTFYIRLLYGCIYAFRLWFHYDLSKHHKWYKMDLVRCENTIALQTD